MIRQKKSFVRPKKPFEKERIKEENKVKDKYGLKNKREIWKALAKINYFRSRAKALANSPTEEQKVFFNKLNAIGLKVKEIADVLGLKVEDLLERRLQTVVVNKKLTTTTRHARQLITHKKILVDGKVVDSPSYIVPVSVEKSIKIKIKKKQPKPVEPKAEEAPAAETPEEAPATEAPAEEAEQPKEESQDKEESK